MPLSQDLKERLQMLDKNMKKEKDAKDDWFTAVMLQQDEARIAARQHSVKSKKKELRVFQRNIKKKINQIKEERLEEYQTSGLTRQVIEETYKNFELTAKAHTFEDWCTSCNCFHLDKLKDEDSRRNSSSSTSAESSSTTPPHTEQEEN